MILKDFIQSQLSGLRAFIDDPTRNLLFYRALPEMEAMAAKLLAAWSDQEGNIEISFGLTGTFSTAEAFYREAEQGLMEVVAGVVGQLVDEELPVLVPGGVAWDRTYPPLTVEERFAELLEGVARGLAAHFPASLFVIRFDEVKDVRGAAESLLRLSGAVVSPCVKLVVLDDARQPLFPRLEARHDRFLALHYSDKKDENPLSLLVPFLQSGPQRVLGLSLSGEALPRLAQDLHSGPLYGRPVRFYPVEAACPSRARLCNQIYRGFRRLHLGAPSSPPSPETPLPPLWRKLDLEAGSDALPPDIYDTRALESPEATLCELLEYMIASLDPEEREQACVVIQVKAIRDIKEWQLFLSHLAAHAAMASVKYLVLDVDGAAPIPRPKDTVVESSLLVFEFSANDIHDDIAKAAANPELPLKEQVQFRLMAGSKAAVDGRFDQALPLVMGSVALCEEKQIKDLQPLAWWTLGHTLQLQGRLPEARNAYGESLTQAMAQNSDSGSANALMKIGHTFFLEGDFEKAIRSYGLAGQTWTEVGYLFGECEALIWIGEAQAAQKKQELAEQSFKLALQHFADMKGHFADVGREGQAEVLERLARLYQKNQRQGEAASCRAKARALGSQGLVADKPT